MSIPQGIENVLIFQKTLLLVYQMENENTNMKDDF